MAVICTDGPGPDAARLRAERLADHLAHVEAILDRILVAGPLSDAEGRTCGSLLILEVASIAEARRLMAADPYSVPGIWDSVTFQEFRAVAGAWVGGATWKHRPIAG